MIKYILPILVISLVGCANPLSPTIQRWESEANLIAQSVEGEANLKKAESERRVQIEDAKGRLEAAKYLADAEVARAAGVAKANEIIGSSLKNNEAYLRWLYIEGLKENKGETLIYIPTEAGLPVLEAGRFNKMKESK
jgi:regulator of protease activity HflC (stomatin/prohibitin superfamily)